MSGRGESAGIVYSRGVGSRGMGALCSGLRVGLALLAWLAVAGPVRADQTKANNSTALNVGSSWSGNVVPGAADVAIFDNTLTLNTFANTTTPAPLGGDLSFLGIKVGTPTGGPALGQVNNQNGIVISNASSANTLTLGSAGIDLSDASAVPLMIQSKIQVGANQTWNINPASDLITNPAPNAAGSSTSVFNFAQDEDLTFAAQAANAAFNLGGNTVTKTGTGTALIHGGYLVSNGTFNVNNGFLMVQGGSNRTTTIDNTVTINVNSGGVVRYQSNSGAIVANATTNLNNGGILHLTTNNATLTTTVGGVLNVNGSGVIRSAPNPITGNNANAPIIVSANITGNAASNLSLRNTYTNTVSSFQFSGDNSGFLGTVTLDGDAGQRSARLTSNTAGSAAATWVINAGNTLHVAGNISVQLGTLNGDGDVSNPTAATTSTINVGGGTHNGTLSNGAGVLGLTKVGTGTLTLNGTNSHGNTTVAGGTLVAGTSGALGDANTGLTVNTGGTVNLNGNSPVIGSLSGTGGTITNTVAAPVTLTIGNATSPGAFAGVIQDGAGTVGLLKVGSGQLILSGANTYTGTTDVNEGALVVNGSIPAAGTVNVTNATLGGTGSVGNVTSGGGLRPGASTADLSVGNLTASSLTVNGGDFRLDLLTPANADTITVTGAANFAGPATITPTSAPAAGTYVLLSAGTLTGTAPTFNAPPAGTTRSTFALDFDTVARQIKLIVTGNPKTLTWTGANGSTWDVNTTQNWSDNGGVSTNEKFFNFDNVTFATGPTNRNMTLDTLVTPTSVTFNNGAGADYTVSGFGGIADGGLTTVTKSGAGSVTLGTENTYTGVTTVNAGKLVLTGNNTGGGAYVIAAGATLQIGNGGGSGTIADASAITNDGVLSYSRADDVTPVNTITGAGQVRQDGAGTLTLGTPNTFAGGVIVNTGMVRVTSAAAVGTGTATVNPTGTLVLAGTALTTPITLAGGTLASTGGPAQLTNADLTAAAGTTSTVLMSNPLDLSTNSESIVTGTLRGSGNINVSAGTNVASPDAGVGFRLRGTGASDFTGTITLNKSVKGELQTAVAGPFSPAGTGKIVMVGGTFSGALGGDYSMLNLRNNTGAAGGNTDFGNDIEISGPGFVTLNPIGNAPANAVSTLGNLKIGDGQTLGVNKNGTPVYNAAFKTVTLTGGNATFSPVTDGFGSTGGGIANLNLGAIGESAAGAGIVMDGLATLTITGPGTYTGPTAVNRGTLRVSGSIASSSGVTVASGATFDAAASQSVKNLTLANGATATVSAGVLKVGDNVSAAPLSIDSAGGNTAKVDLTTRALAVDHPAATPGATALAAVRSQILTGLSGGTWTGAGITSAGAAADPAGKGVGYALASEVLTPTGGDFLGTTVDGSTVLARYTLLGDATLDGQVDFNDLVKLAQNYNVTDGSRLWFTGDFTYDGNTDFNDLVKLAQNYNTALPTEPVPGASAEFTADLAAALAAVPEPGTLSLLALAACGLAARRRR